RAMNLGALSVFAKPIKDRASLEGLVDTIKDFVERPVKDLLVVGRDEQKRERVLELIGSEDIRVTSVASGKDALGILGERRIDCMVIDPDLPDSDLPLRRPPDRRRAEPAQEPRAVRHRPARRLPRAAPRPDRLLPP